MGKGERAETKVEGRCTPDADGPRPPRSPVRSFTTRRRKPGDTGARSVTLLHIKKTALATVSREYTGSSPTLETAKTEACAY